MITQHKVTFMSPGTFVSESSTKSIETPDVKVAVQMARDIVERHGARPYGFYFETFATLPPVTDAEGNTFEVKSKKLKSSGTYYLSGAVVRSLKEVQREQPGSILAENMRCNRWNFVIGIRGGWTVPMNEEDAVLDETGEIVWKGDKFKGLQ